MYNAHRGMMPQQMSGHARLTELLEAVRALFDDQNGRTAGEYEQQRENFIRQQYSEQEQLRERVQGLESAHIQMKLDYEKQIEQLQRELDRRGGGPPHGAPQHPPQSVPPQIGQGPRDLFGGIMNGTGGQAGTLAAPPQEPTQHQGLPANLTHGSGLNTGPQPPQHQPFAGYNPQGMNGYPQGPPQVHSPNPKNRRGPHGTTTPHQQGPGPGHPMPPYPGSPRGHAPTPPPGPMRQPQPPPQSGTLTSVGNELSKLNIDELPHWLKRTGSGGESPGDEWWAIFNPGVPRKLDVSLVHQLQHSSVVCCVRFSLDGRYVATGCNRIAQIFDVETGQNVSWLEDDNSEKEGDLYIRSVAFSPDGKYLATGAEDKCIRVWDITKKEIVTTFTGHEQDIYSLDFSRNGRLIASGSGDHTVRLWNFETRQPGVVLQIEEGVTTVALSPDGRLVAAGSLDRTVRIWDTETGARIECLDGSPLNGSHKDSVYSVAFSPNGRELVSGSLDKSVKMWDLNARPGASGSSSSSKMSTTDRCIRTFEGHNDFVLSVAFTMDGQWVLSGSKDRGVVFWDPKTGVAQLHLQGHQNSVISVAPSPKGGLFATGSGDMRAKIWRYEPYSPEYRR